MKIDSKIKLSIVIPVYGSELVLDELVSQLQTQMERMKLGSHEFEILLVCDNSPDNSWQVIQKLSKSYSAVQGLRLRMNAGQHNALMAGFAIARGDLVATMDDDLQHSPSDLPNLIAKIDEETDVVYGRFKSRNHARWKILGSRINDVVAGYLLQKPKDLYLSPFRIFKSAIKEQILTYQGPYVYVDGLILAVTRNIKSVDVDHYERYAGESRYGFKKSISLWLKMATSFSIVPLRLTSLLGIVFALLGFLFAVLLIVQKVTIDIMPIGWSSLIVTFLFIGGVQLMALGMIGEYLGRVLLTINKRPQYVVADKVGSSFECPQIAKLD